MIPQPAQYLLRFDDLCPTMAREPWQRFERVLREFGIRPILAVVPDNRDPELQREPPDPEFWAQLRAWEQAGAVIALHGYRHLCASPGRSLVPAPPLTEFAGVPEETQHSWIREGLHLLRSQGLAPRLWVAPRHGFDAATLRALKCEGITALSDGLARVPVVRGGVVWIPQQLWSPEEKSAGLWTICIHTNTASHEAPEQLRAFLACHAQQVTSFDAVMAQQSAERMGVVEHLRESIAAVRLRARRRRVARSRPRL
jgi:predicted deacetylase